MKFDASRFVAHRGYAAQYPENTLVAMAKAIEAGAAFLECDIQLTADHVPVVHHDPTLDRSAGVQGNIMELPLERLAAYSFGEPGRFGPRFSGTRITTLRELADLLAANPAVKLFVELKEESLEKFGAGFMVEKIIEAVAPVIGQCIAISFAQEPLREAAKRGWKETGWVLRRWDDEHRAEAEKLAPKYLFCNYQKIVPVPGSLWPGNWKWALYEITDPGIAQKWFGLGAHMVETMEIEKLLNAFKHSGS